MKQIQTDIGIDKVIEPQENYIRGNFIEDRIEQLLPEENFFLFKIFPGNSQETKLRNQVEARELQRLIDAHQQVDKVYIEEGQIEPQYLTEDERKLLTEGMEQSVEKIQYEVYKSIKLTEQITGEPNEKLVERMKEIEALQKKFGCYL